MMSRQLLAIALVCLGFGLGAYYATGDLGGFAITNFGIAALAGAGALLSAVRGATQAGARPGVELYRSALLLLIVVGGVFAAIAATRDAAPIYVRSEFGPRPLSPALAALLSETPPLEAVLYARARDPRLPATRALLNALRDEAGWEVREERLESQADGRDARPSNLVEIETDRGVVPLSAPSEGAIYEALAARFGADAGELFVATGAGEGDLENRSEGGFSGLAAALATAGLRTRPWHAALGAPVPPEARGLLILRPEKPYTTAGLDTLRGYLDRGGRLAVFLEPEAETNLGELLAEFGIRPIGRRVVDPGAPAAEVGVPGLVVRHFGNHPVVRLFSAGQATFFGGATGFRLEKSESTDRLHGLAFTGIEGRPVGSPELAGDFVPLAVTGERTRTGARIVAFGDADIATNRLLRSVYNIDLVMNGVAWLLERPEQLTLRPKSVRAVTGQRPVVLGGTLLSFFGIGLLVPELLVLAAGLLWLRVRG
jgi:hypothetical protein